MRPLRLAEPWLAVTLVLSAGLSTTPATAQLGVEFQVNTYTTGDQSRPAVAAGIAGTFVAVWESDGPDGSSSGIFGQRFDSAGSPIAAEFQINSYTTNGQSVPAVAADPAGNFVVVWHSFSQDGSFFGIFGQRFDSAANPVGTEFQINSHTQYSQSYPAVAAAGGNFVVVWQSFSPDQDGSDGGIFGQVFDSGGNTVNSEFQVNAYTTAGQIRPAVASDAAGNFVVVWQSFDQDGSSSGVFGQRFDSGGNPVALEFQVNSYTTNYQAVPAVAVDGAGNFVVVWASGGQDGVGSGIFGQRFDSGGGPVASEFQVNSHTTNSQETPAVAIDADGNFVVVWESYFQDGSLDGVFGQRFDSGGSPIASEFQVNSYTTDYQARPAVAVGDDGNFVVVWDSDGQDGSLPGVFAALGGSVARDSSVLEIPALGGLGTIGLVTLLGGAGLWSFRRRRRG